MFVGKIAVSQGFLNPTFYFFRRLRQFHGSQIGSQCLRFFFGRFLALLSMNRLERFCYILHLGFGHNREYVPVEMNCAALIFGLRKHLANSFQHPQAFISNHQFHTVQPRHRSHWKKLTQLALFSFIPLAALNISRYPSSLTAIATKTATFSCSPPQFRLR